MKAKQIMGAWRGSLTVLTVGVCACAGTTGDTYVRFVLDGQTYEAPGAIALAWQTEEGYRIQIGPERIGAVPSGTIHWRGTGFGISELGGQDVDLSDFNDRERDPMIVFEVTDDLNVGLDLGSTFRVRIAEVTGSVLVGTFSGANLVAVEMTEGGSSRQVAISGEFRARLML